MNEPKFVFDTNVLLSAALFKQSVPRQALNKALADGQILTRPAGFASILWHLDLDSSRISNS